jgi:hypothetical protein
MDLRARFMPNGDGDGYSLYLFKEGGGWVLFSVGTEYQDPEDEDRPTGSSLISYINSGDEVTYPCTLTSKPYTALKFFEEIAKFLDVKKD